MSEKSCTFATSKVNEQQKLTNMEATVRQSPVACGYAGTISEEKWDNLHTIDELDSALKAVIHKHFHG